VALPKGEEEVGGDNPGLIALPISSSLAPL
jgi:hypothetical protein